MTAFLADEDFNNKIIRGLRYRCQIADVLTVQEMGLSGAHDSEVIQFALDNNRVLLTHDAKTVPVFVEKRWDDGLKNPGIIIAKQTLPFSTVIEDLILITECSETTDWEGMIFYLPL